MKPGNYDGNLTMTAQTAVTQYRLVKVGTSEDNAVHAGAGDPAIGVALQSAAAGEEFGVRPLNRGGVIECVADGAISVNANVYVGATGYVSASAVGDLVGTALGSAAQAGDRIAVLPTTATGNSLLSNFILKDDFASFTTAQLWTFADSNDGSASVGDVKNGVLSIVTDDSDANANAFAEVATTKEIFKVEAGKSIIGYWRIKLAEANTDDAIFCVGFSSVIGSTLMGNDAAGPVGTYDGALVFKVDGGTVFQGETSNAGTQNTDTNIGAFVTDTWYDVVIEILTDSASDTAATVNFYINGTLGGTESLTISGLEEMHAVSFVKSGSAYAETLEVDYVFASQVR